MRSDCRSRLAQRIAPLVLALAAALAPVAHASASPAKGAIAWQVASSDAEVDKAFALAKQDGKPVFLYWGAVWCPPCNQVKATLFNRPDFIERSRAFVPVYVDGDKPGAQKVAARFKVSGYPTMVLFRPDGSEITRLPGEVDPQRYLLTLTSALDAQAPVKDLVERALRKQPLTAQQWRLLAFYSWETDEQQLVRTADLPKRLSELAAAVPSDLPLVRDRLAFKAANARSDADDKKPDAAALEADRRAVDRVLAAGPGSEELSDLVFYYAESMVKYLAPEGKERAALAHRWESAMDRLLAAQSVSAAVRIDALDSRIALWKFEEGDTLSVAHRNEVLRDVARIVAQATDRYERQAVIPSAAHVLTAAGLIDESDKLLKAELPRAVAPYYHMLVLAGNAKKRGDAQGALQWYEQAWKKSEGPATRLQWGSGYVGNIIELTPGDVNRVSAAAGSVISALEPKNETFFERNERTLQRMARKLTAWEGKDPARAKAVAKLRDQLARTCARLPAKQPGRANCDNVFSGAQASS
ncbi:MAG TPA: thioredoxin family protein [Ramlibacter sp.]|uniref:thioredoxin family protein n=1 Tax=Ramlibacter sp. TaxID=1917967 RepID=UPI002BAB246C|nr:thioredoxin family protein [Ramlibacter sp.]HVZ44103.1 thioredoxin family protein [Ramlibacter sp.]